MTHERSKQQMPYTVQDTEHHAKFSDFEHAILYAEALSKNGGIVEVFRDSVFLGHARDGVIDPEVRSFADAMAAYKAAESAPKQDYRPEGVLGDHLGLGDENHTWIRALERYGAVMSDADYDHMIDCIRKDRAYFLAKISKSGSIYLVHWREIDRVVPVLYHKKRGAVSTILPSRNAGGPIPIVKKYPQVQDKIDWLASDPKDRPPVP